MLIPFFMERLGVFVMEFHLVFGAKDVAKNFIFESDSLYPPGYVRDEELGTAPNGMDFVVMETGESYIRACDDISTAVQRQFPEMSVDVDEGTKAVHYFDNSGDYNEYSFRLGSFRHDKDNLQVLLVNDGESSQDFLEVYGNVKDDELVNVFKMVDSCQFLHQFHVVHDPNRVSSLFDHEKASMSDTLKQYMDYKTKQHEDLQRLSSAEIDMSSFVNSHDFGKSFVYTK